MKRKGLGKGLGKGYKNIVPRDPFIHGLSAKGIPTMLVSKTDKNKRTVQMLKIPKRKLDKLDKIGMIEDLDPAFNKLDLSAKGKRPVGVLEWDSREDNFVVLDDDSNELDRWYPDDLVQQYITKWKIDCDRGEWDNGEYVCYDKNNNEVDRIYAEELIKQVAHKQRKHLGYDLMAKGLDAKGKKYDFPDFYGELSDEELEIFSSMKFIYHETQNIWSIPKAKRKGDPMTDEIAFVMNQLDLSRPKAEKVVKKFLDNLEKLPPKKAKAVVGLLAKGKKKKFRSQQEEDEYWDRIYEEEAGARESQPRDYPKPEY